jgi:hypothetical protein
VRIGGWRRPAVLGVVVVACLFAFPAGYGRSYVTGTFTAPFPGMTHHFLAVSNRSACGAAHTRQFGGFNNSSGVVDMLLSGGLGYQSGCGAGGYGVAHNNETVHLTVESPSINVRNNGPDWVNATWLLSYRIHWSSYCYSATCWSSFGYSFRLGARLVDQVTNLSWIIPTIAHTSAYSVGTLRSLSGNNSTWGTAGAKAVLVDFALKAHLLVSDHYVIIFRWTVSTVAVISSILSGNVDSKLVMNGSNNHASLLDYSVWP